MSSGRRVLTIAHRGAPEVAPENTLKAFQAALAQGAEMIELDVRATRDGVLVVAHDEDLRRLTGRKGKLSRLTLAELKAYRVAGEPVPTLEAVLDWAHRRISLDLELKARGVEGAVVRLVKTMGMWEGVLVSSSRLPALRRLRLIEPHSQRGWLLRRPPAALLLRRLLANDRDSGRGPLFQVLLPHWTVATRRLCQVAQRAGHAVYVWTVDDPNEITEFLGRGVDGIISNRPALCRAIITQAAGVVSVPR